MPIFKKIEDYRPDSKTVVLVIGNFDGMHRGHCAVLKRAFQLARDEGEVAILTFSNHPSEILRPGNPTPLLSSIEQKIHLLTSFGVENIILIPFTEYLSKHSAKFFIEYLRNHFFFNHLVLGHDATLGRDRQGNPPIMKELGIEWGFSVHYIEPYRYEGHLVSSTTIREELKQGHLEKVEELLNRPYSILGTVISGSGEGSILEFPTANLSVKNLCLPPFGVYAVKVDDCGTFYEGIANLGIAPTIRDTKEPILEVHFFDHRKEPWLGCTIEVIFKQFIRPELINFEFEKA